MQWKDIISIFVVIFVIVLLFFVIVEEVNRYAVMYDIIELR